MKKRQLIVRLLVLAVLLVGLSSFLRTSRDSFVQIEKGLFASRYEVTNYEFREFLQDIKVKGTDPAKFLYDSSQWVRKFPYSYNQPMVNFYHWHSAYDNYPVVNITRETAESYCDWLTQNYNNSTLKKFKKVRFRLPTEAEWIHMAGISDATNLPWTEKDGQQPPANIKARDKMISLVDYKFDGELYTSEVGKFKANKYGLFDVVGNAMEMTRSGVQKGGSWDSFIEECQADKVQKLSLPDPRVGFRVVLEVVEE